MRHETHRGIRVGGAAGSLPSMPYLRFGNPGYDPAKATPTGGESHVDAQFRRTAGAPVVRRQQRQARIAEYRKHRQAGLTLDEAAQAVRVKRDTAIRYERELTINPEDSPAVTTPPDGRGLNAAVEAPPAALLDAAPPRGGVQGISPCGVAHGESAGPVPPGPASTSPLEPAPPGSRGAREGELPAPLRTADGSSLPDTDPVGSTRSTASLPAARGAR